MAYHRQRFFKEIQNGNNNRSKSTHFISEHNQINDTLATTLFQGTKTDRLSIQERFSFERIEESIDKVQDFQRQFQTVQDQLEVHHQTTQKNFHSQGAKIETLIQHQLPQQIENIEQTVINLQLALQRQVEQAQRQQELNIQHNEQILKLQETNSQLQQVILEMQIKLEAKEMSDKLDSIGLTSFFEFTTKNQDKRYMLKSITFVVPLKFSEWLAYYKHNVSQESGLQIYLARFMFS